MKFTKLTVVVVLKSKCKHWIILAGNKYIEKSTEIREVCLLSIRPEEVVGFGNLS